jgi:hypothetical protein
VTAATVAVAVAAAVNPISSIPSHHPQIRNPKPYRPHFFIFLFVFSKIKYRHSLHLCAGLSLRETSDWSWGKW